MAPAKAAGPKRPRGRPRKKRATSPVCVAKAGSTTPPRRASPPPALATPAAPPPALAVPPPPALVVPLIRGDSGTMFGDVAESTYAARAAFFRDFAAAPRHAA